MTTQRWWLSFADPDRPAGQRSLGACCLYASDLMDAVRRAKFMGIDPGGEVMGFPVADDRPEIPLNRLMQREEIEARDRARGYL